jgi:RNA polymerase sigma-70 factor (ECF subfamily)
METNPDLRTQILEAVRRLGLDVVQDPAVRGLRPDFLVRLNGDATAVIEAAEDFRLDRLRGVVEQAQYYAQALKSTSAIVVVPTLPSTYNQPSPTVIVVDIDHFEAELRRLNDTSSMVQTKVDALSDAELATRAAEGDTDAFEVIVQRYTPELWRIAYSRLQNRSEAEDAVMDTWLAAYRALRSRLTDASLRKQLRDTCFSISAERSKRPHPQQLGEIGLLRDAEAMTDNEQSIVDRLAVSTALTRLPEELREPLLLLIAGFTVAEAAQKLGVTSGTIRARVARARQALIAMLPDIERSI